MSAAGQIIESIQLLEMIINNEYGDGDDIDDDDDDDDIDDVMKEGRLLIGQRGVSNSMLYPAILSSSLSSKCSVQILWFFWFALLSLLSLTSK